MRTERNHLPSSAAISSGHDVEHHEPAGLTLNRRGAICNCNAAAETLFGFHHDELLKQPISRLLPELADIEWVQDGRPNHHLSFLSRIGQSLQAVTRDGRQFASRFTVTDLGNAENCRLRMVIWRAEDDAQGGTP